MNCCQKLYNTQQSITDIFSSIDINVKRESKATNPFFFAPSSCPYCQRTTKGKQDNER